MAAPTDRRQRRAAQAKAARARAAQAPRRTPSVGRRRLVWGMALVIVLVGAGGIISLATGPSTPTAPPPASAPVLAHRTLLSIPAASSVATGAGGSFATDDYRNLLVRFDPTSGHITKSLHLNGRPVAMVLAGSHLWVANMVSNSVEEVSAATLRLVRTVPVPTGPSSLAVLNGEVWVASVIANEVTPINEQTGVAGARLPVPAGAVRLAAGFGALWVTGSTDGLTEIAPDDHGPSPVTPPIAVGNGPIGVATGDGAVWVADAASGKVVEVDPRTRTVLHTYAVGGDPLSVAVSAGKVWVADGSAQTLRTLFPAPKSLVLNLDATPRTMLAVPGGIWVGVANPGQVVRVTTTG